MTIFIPVLIICINAQCEFQQALTHYKTESQCRTVMTQQKTQMQTLTARAGTTAVIEGTCISADVKTTTGYATGLTVFDH
jgi:hypothetical protein